MLLGSVCGAPSVAAAAARVSPLTGERDDDGGSAPSIAEGTAPAPPAAAEGVLPGTLYGTDGLTLYAVDKKTGVTTVIGSHDLPPSETDKGVFMGDIAFDRCGTLYGLKVSLHQNGASAIPAQLHTIDVATGAAKPVGMPLETNVFEGGLAFAPDGTLFAVNENDANTATLLVIDKLTGAATTVGPAGGANRDLNGLAFDDKTLFAIDRVSNTVGTVDPATGEYAPIGNPDVTIGPTGGVAIDPADRVLYATFAGTGGFYRLDKTTGAATFIETRAATRGLAFVPPSCDDGDVCSTDGCDAVAGRCTHAPAASGVECRPAAGVCDVAETCTGETTACPIDGFAGPATVCRSAAGECDEPEQCTGVAAACPPDAVKPADTDCADDGNACTVDHCNGASATCQHTSDPTCPCGNGTVEPANDEECDLGTANGAATSCCTNTCRLRAAGGECRASAGLCDVAETCTASSPTCPGDAVRPSATPCRPAAGACDVMERCDGADVVCPPDVVQPASTPCTPDDDGCTLDRCDGASVTCQHTVDPTCTCGNGTVEPAKDEACDAGAANGTPASCCTGACTFRGAGAACRSSAGPCDVAEQCSGADASCPPDATASDGTGCSDGLFCNGSETCANGLCGNHTGDPCPGADGDADCAESCAEATQTCTAVDPNGTSCTDANACTLGDVCGGGACAGGQVVHCPGEQVCNPTNGICGPSLICTTSCDDQNPCTTDQCDTTLGTCVNVPVADGQSCADDDECTTGTNACGAGTCGTRECNIEVTQVLENGVPQPVVELDCLLFARKPNGKVKNGSCVAQLLDATGREAASRVIGEAARRKKPKAGVLSAKRRVRIKNGRGTLLLALNEQGKQLLDASADGVLRVAVQGTIKSKGTRARISKVVGLRR